MAVTSRAWGMCRFNNEAARGPILSTGSDFFQVNTQEKASVRDGGNCQANKKWNLTINIRTTGLCSAGYVTNYINGIFNTETFSVQVL